MKRCFPATATRWGRPVSYTHLDVYKRQGSAFIPYTLLTWPNDYFYQLHVYAKDNVNLDQFFDQFKAYAAKMHGRQPEDMYMYTAMQEMTSVDTMMGGLSMAVSYTHLRARAGSTRPRRNF